MLGCVSQPTSQQNVQQTYNQEPTNSEQATTSANKKQTNTRVMKFFCVVMLVGILVSCSHGRANPTDMLAKVRRDETVCGPCGVLWCGVRAQEQDFHVFFFFACDGGGAVDFPRRVILFCFSLQFQALFHMPSNVNMWWNAWGCCEKLETRDTLWKVNGLFCDAASSPSFHSPFMFVIIGSVRTQISFKK